MTSVSPIGAALPPVHLIDREYDLITDLALRIGATQPALADGLMRELERAKVHPPQDMPEGAVTLGAQVTFIDEGSGAQRCVRVVLPAAADIAAGNISILTPIGAGLIGLSPGDAIPWPDREGHVRMLRIVSVAPAAPA